MQKAAERWILFLSLIVNAQSASPGKWIASYLLFCHKDILGSVGF